MFSVIHGIVTDTLKEKQPDGRPKWSFMRLSAFAYFWLCVVPSVWANLIYNKPVSPEIAMIAGVFFLGVVGGKGVSAYAGVVQQGLNKLGGDQNAR